MKTPKVFLLLVILLLAIFLIISVGRREPSEKIIKKAIMISSQEGWHHLPRGIEEIEVIQIGKKEKIIFRNGKQKGWLVKVRLKGDYNKTPYNQIITCFVFKRRGRWLERKGEWDAANLPLEMFKE